MTSKKKDVIEKEPLEKLKELVGFKWYSIITFLFGLYPVIFGIGFYFGGLSARTEISQTFKNNVTDQTSFVRDSSLVRYEQVISENKKEKKQIQDSLEAFSKRLKIFTRVIKQSENGQSTKK